MTFHQNRDIQSAEGQTIWDQQFNESCKNVYWQHIFSSAEELLMYMPSSFVTDEGVTLEKSCL
jgi:hypothetical protein